MTMDERAKRRRWPWNVVCAFAVQSCADGTLIIRPQYLDGSAGVLTRMALAAWCQARLAKRGAVSAAGERDIGADTAG